MKLETGSKTGSETGSEFESEVNNGLGNENDFIPEEKSEMYSELPRSVRMKKKILDTKILKRQSEDPFFYPNIPVNKIIGMLGMQASKKVGEKILNGSASQIKKLKETFVARERYFSPEAKNKDITSDDLKIFYQLDVELREVDREINNKLL